MSHQPYAWNIFEPNFIKSKIRITTGSQPDLETKSKGQTAYGMYQAQLLVNVHAQGRLSTLSNNFMKTV